MDHFIVTRIWAKLWQTQEYDVLFGVLRAEHVKNSVFWVYIIMYSGESQPTFLEEHNMIQEASRGLPDACFMLAFRLCTIRPWRWSNMFFWVVSRLLSDYTVSHHKDRTLQKSFISDYFMDDTTNKIALLVTPYVKHPKYGLLYRIFLNF